MFDDEEVFTDYPELRARLEQLEEALDTELTALEDRVLRLEDAINTINQQLSYLLTTADKF